MRNCFKCRQQISKEQGTRRLINSKKIGIIAGINVIFVVIIILVINLMASGAHTPQAAIELYINAAHDRDVKNYLDVCVPKKLLKAMKKDFRKNGNYILEDKIEQSFRGFAFSDAEDIRKIKVIDIIDMEEKFDKKDFENQIKDKYNVKIKISKLVFVHFEYELKYNGKWEEHKGSVRLYKTGGRWFVFSDYTLMTPLKIK